MITALFILFSFAAFALWVTHAKLKMPSLYALVLLAEMALSVLILGVFEQLTKGGLLFVAILLFAFLLGYFFYKRPSFNIKVPPLTVEGFLRFILLSILVIGVSYFARITPVVDIDSLGYHLPIVFNLIKTHSIWDVFHAGFVGPNTYFPANHEAIQSFLTLIVGDIRFNYLATLLGFFVLLQSIYLLNKDKKPSLFTLIVLLSTASIPFLFNQFLFFQIDLFLFCLLGASMAFLMASVIHKNPKYLIGFFLAFSLALGTKFNALLQGVLIFPFFLGVLFYFRKEWRVYLPAIIVSIPLGILWYVRNLVTTGNPFFPFGVLSFKGHSKFLDEMQGTSILDTLHQQTPPEIIEHVTSNPDFTSYLGFPPLILLALAGAGVLFVFFSLFFKSRAANRGSTLFYGFIFCLTLLLMGEILAYLASPYTFTLWNETVRYAAPIFAVLLILIILLSQGSKWLRTIFYVVCTLVLGLNLAHSFWFNSDYLALAQGRISKNEFLTEKLSGYAPLATAMEALKVKPMGPIALAGITFYGLLEEEGFEPYYINVDGCESCQYPDYRDLADSVRSFPNEAAWKKLLQTKSIRYLLVGFNNYHNAGRQLYEKEWADKDPQMFEKLVESDGIALYEIHYQ